MHRYSKVYLKMILAQMKAEMQYKVDFFIGVFSTIALQAASIGLIWVIFQNIQQLQGYSFEHIILIYGTATLARSINHMFFDNLWVLPDDYVRSGEFDRLLTKPLNPLFYLIAERWQRDGVGNLLTGIAVVSYAVQKMHFSFTFWSLALYIVFVICGGLVYGAVNLITSSFSFRFVKVFALITVIFNFNEFSKYPISIYNQALKITLTWLIPFAFTSFYPVEALVNGFTRPETYLIVPFSLFFVWASYIIWRWNLGAYSSTGS